VRRATMSALVSALTHTNAHVRFEAVKHVLARFPEEQATEHAVVALSDPESAVRRAAQEFLVNVAPTAAAPALERLVRDASWKKRDLGEQRRLLLAYGRTGGTAAIRLLIDILEQRRRKDDDELREAAAEILAILRPLPARPVLARLAEAKKEKAAVREAAARAVAAIDAAPAERPGTGPRGVPAPAVLAPVPATPGSHPPLTRPTRPPTLEPIPIPVLGSPPALAALAEDDVAMVAEEPLWQDEPPARRAPPPEIAALLME